MENNVLKDRKAETRKVANGTGFVATTPRHIRVQKQSKKYALVCK